MKKSCKNLVVVRLQVPSSLKKVGNIIRKEESRRYVIPSAPGKRTPDDTKVTDMLYSCYGQAILGEDAERDF